MGYRGRITLVLAGIVLLATLAVAMLALQVTRAQLSRDIDASLARLVDRPLWDQVAAAPSDPRPELRRGLSRGGALPPELQSPQLQVQINQIVPQGTASAWVAFGSTPLKIPERVIEQAATEGTAHASFEQDGTPYHAEARALDVPGAVVVATRDVTTEQAALRRLAQWFVVVGLAVGGLAVLAGWFVAGALVRPLARLTWAAEAIARSGDPDADVRTDTTDEAGRLSRAFQDMLGALRQSRDQQRQLVADAGHELRTPVSSIMSNAEVLRRHPELGAGTRDEIAADLVAESRELAALVDGLVVLAGPTDLAEPMVVCSWAEIVTAAVRSLPREQRERIRLSGDAPVQVRAGQMRRAVLNVLGNACKFDPSGAPVSVRASEAEGWARLCVVDQGPGVADRDLPHVTERFYRSDVARSTPGSGLGLAIVAEVLGQHGGTVSVGNEPHAGACVCLALPAAIGIRTS